MKKLTYLGLGAGILLAFALGPASLEAQGDPNCGDDCEPCAGLHNYKVETTPEGETFASTGGDCVYRYTGCGGMFPCGPSKDEDYENIEELALALRSNDSGVLSSCGVAVFGSPHASRRAPGSHSLRGVRKD